MFLVIKKYVFIYVYMYDVYVCMSVRPSVRLSVCHVCMYLIIYLFIYTYTYMNIHVCVCIFIYIHVCFLTYDWYLYVNPSSVTYLLLKDRFCLGLLCREQLLQERQSLMAKAPERRASKAVGDESNSGIGFYNKHRYHEYRV